MWEGNGLSRRNCDRRCNSDVGSDRALQQLSVDAGAGAGFPGGPPSAVESTQSSWQSQAWPNAAKLKRHRWLPGWGNLRSISGWVVFSLFLSCCIRVFLALLDMIGFLIWFSGLVPFLNGFNSLISGFVFWRCFPFLYSWYWFLLSLMLQFVNSNGYLSSSTLESSCWLIFLAICRLYYTKLQLGSPPRDYYVQIDTGSDVLWVSCGSCNGCPETSGLPVRSQFLVRFIVSLFLRLWQLFSK